MNGGNTQKERVNSYRGLELLPVHLYVLAHLRRAGVDYAKMMAKMSGLNVELINGAIKDLTHVGLLERDSGSAIKRSRARFKKAFEVHKHHTYYKLSREGELFVRSIDERWLRKYFNTIIPDGWKVVKALAGVKELEELKRELDIGSEVEEELRLHHFITDKGRKTDFFRLLWEFLM